MKTILERGKNWIGRAALVAVAMVGFAGFLGAGTASAHPRFYAYGYAGPRVVYGGPGYYGPGPVYVGPAYGPYYRPYYRPYRYHRVYRFWDERGHCWRYR
jgi:hypothetical protein